MGLIKYKIITGEDGEKRKNKEKNELSRIKIAHMLDINLVILIITFKGNNLITTKIRVELKKKKTQLLFERN